MHYRSFIFLALAAAFANILPLLLVEPAGDTVMNYMQVQCFSKQLWSGILYPRWCMDANAGLGSPAPIFYFPLPFYITAMFAPLHHIGMTIPQHYLLGIYAANVTAFICCAAWLSRFVSRRTALFCALIFLFGFYRAEMITRASYAEYWCVAFMPLIFMYARDACHFRVRTWPKLALAITVCMFCHAPATLIGLMGAGLYMLMMNGRALPTLALSCLIAAIAGIFHYLPMKTLTHTLNDEMGGVNHWRRSWVNSFIEQLFSRPEQFWSLVALAIGVLTALCIGTLAWHKRRTLPPGAWDEARSWLIIGTFALCMMFAVSKPLWFIVEMISGVATPWRMQLLILFSLVANFALLAEYVLFQNARTQAGDKIICTLFFVFSSLFYAGGVAEKSLDIHKQLIQSQYALIYFATKDTDIRYKSVDLFFKDFIDLPNRQQAEWTKGSGALNIAQWNERGIVITGHANTAGTLRLEHFHYPIWQATLNSNPIAITPEPIKGRMIISVPKGDFTLWLRMNYPAFIAGSGAE